MKDPKGRLSLDPVLWEPVIVIGSELLVWGEKKKKKKEKEKEKEKKEEEKKEQTKIRL